MKVLRPSFSILQHIVRKVSISESEFLEMRRAMQNFSMTPFQTDTGMTDLFHDIFLEFCDCPGSFWVPHYVAKKPPEKKEVMWFNLRRRRGVDATPPPAVFLEYFFLPVECHHFSIVFCLSFLRSHENFKTMIPLRFDLWPRNWSHVRRKMRSVAHNFKTSPFLLVIWMWTCSTK